MNSVLLELIACLVLTIVLEIIPTVALLRIPIKYFILVNVLTNVVSNVTIIVYDICYNTSGCEDYFRLGLIYTIEIIVIVLESILYYMYHKSHNINKSFLYIIIIVILVNAFAFCSGNFILAKF